MIILLMYFYPIEEWIFLNYQSEMPYQIVVNNSSINVSFIE